MIELTGRQASLPASEIVATFRLNVVLNFDRLSIQLNPNWEKSVQLTVGWVWFQTMEYYQRPIDKTTLSLSLSHSLSLELQTKQNKITTSMTMTTNNNINNNIYYITRPEQIILAQRFCFTNRTGSRSIGGPSECCYTRCWSDSRRSMEKTKRNFSSLLWNTVSVTQSLCRRKAKTFARPF